MCDNVHNVVCLFVKSDQSTVVTGVPTCDAPYCVYPVLSGICLLSFFPFVLRLRFLLRLFSFSC